jgi:hypothetical protein
MQFYTFLYFGLEVKIKITYLQNSIIKTNLLTPQNPTL